MGHGSSKQSSSKQSSSNQSSSKQSIVCHTQTTIRPNEFHLSLDSQAFDFHVLSRVSAMRVTRIDSKGQWHMETDRVYTPEKPYVDEHIKLAPEGHSGRLIVEKPIEMLWPLHTETVLCEGPAGPVVYINLVLKRIKAEPKTYVISDNSILFYNNTIVIINLPDAPVKPNIQQVIEKSFDPNLLFMSKPG